MRGEESPAPRRRRVPDGGVRAENFFRLFFGFPLGMGLALQLLDPESGAGITRGDLGVPAWTGFVAGMGFATVPTILIAWFAGKRRIPWAFRIAFTLGALVMLLIWLDDRSAKAGS